MDEDTSGSTPLFAVFLISMVSIFLIPYTLYTLFGGDDDETEVRCQTCAANIISLHFCSFVYFCTPSPGQISLSISLSLSSHSAIHTHSQVVKTWHSKKDKQQPGIVASIVTRLKETFSTKLIIAWILYLLLLWYVTASSSPMDRFDPFEILQVSESASEADIKKAYRKLSLQFHPDKNPDPGSADYFANYIAKAYRSLTDPASRENYKKYGHPDGPQAVSISVALPEWFFNKDKDAAPAILLTLLLGGIVLPLGLAACYLGRSQKFTGPNEVMPETTQMYIYSPYGVKQYQGVGRLPETLVCAMEFLPPQFNMTAEQGPPMDALRRELGAYYPEMRDKNGTFFRKRRPHIIKAHMLLLAHMARVTVDPVLKKDLLYVLEKTPRLIQEVFGVASMGRVKPGYGWLAPAVATVEAMQCLVQAVSVEEKKKTLGNPGKSADGVAALYQMPHFDDDVLKKLAKKKIKTLAELQKLAKNDRREALQTAGLSVADVEEVETALSALPSLFITARLYADEDAAPPPSSTLATGNEMVVSELAVLTCEIHTMLLRASHQAPGFDADSIKGKGSVARAYAPNFPFPRDEHWFFLLGDASNGTLLAWTRVALLEAEAAGAQHAANWKNTQMVAAAAADGGSGNSLIKGGGGSSSTTTTPSTASPSGTLLQLAAAGGGGGEEFEFESDDALIEKLGQKVEFKCLAPPAGKHNLVLYAMPDSWIGVDKVVPLRVKTVEVSRAEREGRIGGGGIGGGANTRGSGGGGTAASTKKKGGGGGGSTAAGDLQRSEESELLLGGGDDDDAAAGVVDGDGNGSGSDEDGSEEDGSEDEGEAEWDSDEYGTEETDEEGDDGESDGDDE